MTKVLIVNQHGGNRGDEAACRGMIYGLRRFIPGADIRIATVYPLELKGLTDIPLTDNLCLRDLGGQKVARRMLGYIIDFYAGSRARPQHRELLTWYREADLIISAPGGPYLGDLYPWTEKELAFHIMLGTLSRSPVMVYAPSMGPFERRFSNRWRRMILKRVDLITVRESISAGYLSSLGIHLDRKYITADSALQQPVQPDLGESVFRREGLVADRKYIGFVPLEIERFRTDSDRMHYIEVLTQLLRLLSQQFDAHFVVFPQRCGIWDDTPFIEFIVSVSGEGNRVHIVSAACNSDEQQALVGRMDGFISFRYHPTIFAMRQYVPCVAVTYEHKLRGFMQAVGMDEYCFDVGSVTAAQVLQKFEELWGERNEIRKRVESSVLRLERESLKNSYLAMLLMKHRPEKGAASFDALVDEHLRGEWWNV